MCPKISCELCRVVNPKSDCECVLNNKRNRWIDHCPNNNKLSVAHVAYLAKDTHRHEEGKELSAQMGILTPLAGAKRYGMII